MESLSITTEAADDGCAWVIADVSLIAWSVIDALRMAEGRPSRSGVAEAAVRRALALDVEVRR